jgi:hypothetical protein
MHFVVIFGPPAVGKMTVGHALAERTGLKLFHNHMTIDVVLQFFPFGHPTFSHLVSSFRRHIFEEVATSELPGVIFTYVWALDNAQDKAEVDAYCNIFHQHGAHVVFVELEADQDERIQRNKTEFRLHHKPSKRDIVRSERNLLDSDQTYKLNSNDDFFYPDQHIKINNTNVSPHDAARLIIDRFALSAT